tara:strand:+ start:79 stop:810 length:732 start_codon:yes stop_codon:yes gene_type:complete
MILTIDIGNTKIKYGVFEKNNLVFNDSFDDYDSFIKNINKLKKHNLKNVAISSVVPNYTNLCINVIKKNLNLNSFTVNNKNCNIVLDVDKPSSVGADRLCNMTAAYKLYKIPSIIIDFGTANTYDVINKKNVFIGGVISPGIETSAQYLINKAALLKKTELQFPKKVIGKNTTTNIQSGIMHGAVDQISGMIKRIKKETKIDDYSIILTGGFGNKISPKLEIPHILDEHLTLKGLLFIYNANS